MINRVTIKLPYQKRFGLISINSKKKVSFSFDNLSLFIFREDNKIDTTEDFSKWRKEHSEFDLFVHAAFCAAKSYCMHEKKSFKLQLNKFALGLAQVDKDELQRLIDVWNNSQSYGADSIKGKKKVAKVN